MRRKLIVLLALLVLMLGLPGVAQAGGDADDDGSRSGNNAAVAINTKSGSSLFKFAFAIRRVLGDVVDNENAAVAYSSCESCRTTAIAIQIVFVVGSPSTVTPKNFAVAINENCTACQSFAAAFQFVVGVPDASVGFTKEGKRELKQILREFKALKRENYTLEEFHARTQALAQRLRTLLKTQLVSKRSDDHDEGEGEGEGDEDDEEVEDEAEEDERPAPPPPPATTGAETDTATTATTESAPTTTASTSTETETEPGTETETETGPGETTTTP